MRRLIWGLALLPLLAAPGAGQTIPSSDARPVGIACAYNTSVPTLADKNLGYVQCDSTGKLIISNPGSGGGGGSSAVQYNASPRTAGEGTTAAPSGDINYDTIVATRSGKPLADNLSQINGNAPATGSGASNTGTLRTILATDQSAVPVTGTFFQATQPVSGTVTANQGSGGASAWKVDGSAVTQPISAAALPLPTGAATAANQIATTGPAAPGTSATSSSLAGLQFNTTPPTATNGQQVAQQADANGNTKVNLATALPAGANNIGSVGATTATGGLTAPFRLQSSAASTNATSVKASAGRAYKIRAYNTTGSPIYLKLYNKASAPTVGTDTPFDVYVLSPGNNSFDNADIGWTYSAGIAFATTTGTADTDTTAVTAGAITALSIGYQ